MLDARAEINELATATFERIVIMLNLDWPAIKSLFGKHRFLNDLDICTVSLFE